MRIVSLFSGAGGLDLGLIQAGHDVVWANDIDIDSCETYRHNIGNHIVCGDICDIDAAGIPDCDVVVGGFPCQGFSMANKFRGIDDERNSLYRQFCRVLTVKRPRYFIAENVKGILSLDGGNAIKQIVDDFTDIGYTVAYKVFNMADYGVPQTRVRVIIVGSRLDQNRVMEFPEPTHNVNTRVSMSDALRGIPEPDSEHSLTNHVGSAYKITNRNYTAHRQTDPDKPSPTILARGNGKGGVCAIPHYNNRRRLTIRESAIMQTFPIDFYFTGKMGSAYRQIGNAVPVVFGRIMGDELNRIEL